MSKCSKLMSIVESKSTNRKLFRINEGSYDITVGEVKSMLSNALDILEELDNDAELAVQSNTYFVDIPYLGTSAGFIDLTNIQLKDDE